MRRPAREEDDPSEVTERAHVRREPLPAARAILWKPLPDSYHLLASMMRTPEQQAHLFVTQRAFLQVERHLQSAPDLEIGGFLAGHLYECPKTHLRYAVVNTVVPLADVTGEAIGTQVTQRAYDAVRRRLDAHGLVLVGWYRNSMGLGLQLLPDDVETHLSFFHEPWQATMLVVPDPVKTRGAFFTYDPRVGRGYCIPFYELFDQISAESNRLDRTSVTWTTYVASVPVQPLPVSDREIVEMTVAPIRPIFEPEPIQPIDEWWDAIKDPWLRLKDAAAAVSARREESARAQQQIIRPPPAPRKPVAEPKPRVAPVRREQRVPSERETSPRAAPSPRATQARPEAAPREPVPPPAPRPAPHTPPAPLHGTATPSARQKPAVGAMPPAVALPPDFHEDAVRWQRRRRIGFAVAAASFLGVIIVSTIQARSEKAAQAARNVAPPAASVVAVATPDGASENGHESLTLAAAVDSLSGALAYYRDIANDHRDGLVGCRVLDRAYALVGRARTRLDSSRQQIAGGLADADSIRVSMLAAEYTFVTQTYSRSGCRA